MSEQNDAPVHHVVGRLRELLGASKSPLPWAWGRGNHRDATHWLRDSVGGVILSLIYGKDGDSAIPDDEDAELIVAAINAMPALLEIAEAAQSVQDGMDMRDEDETELAAAGTRVSAMEMHDRRMRLARALSLLPNAMDHRAPEEKL